jgi:hypothetical protein
MLAAALLFFDCVACLFDPLLTCCPRHAPYAGLSQKDMVAGLLPVIESVRACRPWYAPWARTVRVDVSPAGSVTGVGLVGYVVGKTEATCVDGVVRQARFVPAQGDTRFTYWLPLR